MSFPPASHPSAARERFSQLQWCLRFPQNLLSMDRAVLQDAKAQPRLSQHAGGSRQLVKGPPIPSHPRGVAVASLEPFKEAHYAPGPRPAAARGYTWKSSAAGSASASVAAGPDRSKNSSAHPGSARAARSALGGRWFALTSAPRCFWGGLHRLLASLCCGCG